MWYSKYPANAICTLSKHSTVMITRPMKSDSQNCSYSHSITQWQREITFPIFSFLDTIRCPVAKSLLYTNTYCNERLWLKLWARGDCNNIVLFTLGKIAQLHSCTELLIYLQKLNGQNFKMFLSASLTGANFVNLVDIFCPVHSYLCAVFELSGVNHLLHLFT